MNWATIEAAIAAWVRSASGLSDDGSVRWGEQNAAQSARPMIILRAMAVRGIGQDWVNVEDNPAPEEGEEILNIARGYRELTISIQCFAASSTGSSSARAILENVRSRATLPTIRQALADAGVGLAPIGPVIAIDGVLGSARFEPRATLEVRAFLASEVSEVGTYIEIVQAENESTGSTFEVP